MSQTLYQRLVYGKERVEDKVFNPARAKIGTSFSLDVMNYRDRIFVLRELWEYRRTIDGKEHTFGDYVLRVVDGDDSVRVRFVPAESGYDVLLLTKYDEMMFNMELDDACRADTGELTVTWDDQEETYWRPDEITSSYMADVSVVKDVNGDGKVDSDEVEKLRVEYWDYARDTKDEAGQTFTQFLIVEMDDHSKVQTMWRGETVDPERVTVI